jgi:hypothetical protein
MLGTIATDLGARVLVGYADVSSDDDFTKCFRHSGGLDLVIIVRAAGFWILSTKSVPSRECPGLHGDRVDSFPAFSGARPRALDSYRLFAALRGSRDGTVYSVSKTFQSVYLDGLHDSAQQKRLSITVTELQFVDTAMMKTATPLLPAIHRLIVADATTAARQKWRIKVVADASDRGVAGP